MLNASVKAQDCIVVFTPKLRNHDRVVGPIDYSYAGSLIVLCGLSLINITQPITNAPAINDEMEATTLTNWYLPPSLMGPNNVLLSELT